MLHIDGGYDEPKIEIREVIRDSVTTLPEHVTRLHESVKGINLTIVTGLLPTETTGNKRKTR